LKSIFITTLLWLLILSSCKVKNTTTASQVKNENITIQTSSRSDSNKSLLFGNVKFKETGEPVAFCTIVLKQNQITIAGVHSDVDGNFRMEGDWRGEFNLGITFVGTPTLETTIHIDGPSNMQIDALMTENEIIVLKPIIYLYPEKEQEISVRLHYQGDMLFSYPNYPENGWKVRAEPDGTLWDEAGLEYYALFWEGRPDEAITPEEGFVVKGTDTAKFLEEKLSYLGLNRRESNEFIMFWLPRLQNNPYNLIHFAGGTYEKQAVLDIDPKPETSIRVMMLYQPLESEIDFPLQNLSPLHKTRKGYTLVEWGGSEILRSPF
jgi:CarboxypepD_reg-like domain